MRRFLFSILGLLLAVGYFSYCLTLGRRWKRTSFHKHWESYHLPSIRCHWHEDILALVYRHSFKRSCVMASRSRDGELIAQTLKWLGFVVVRGSSSRGGGDALREMVQLTKKAYVMGLAVDGPRGPRHKVKKGIIYLAIETGFPILPSVAASKWFLRVKSWDRMIIPLPFSPVIEISGSPIFIPKDASPETVEQKRCELEIELERLKREAEAYYGNRIVEGELTNQLSS